MKKVVCIAIIAAMILALVPAVNKEVQRTKTVDSVKVISKRPVYEIHYYNDYLLDEYLKTDREKTIDTVRFWNDKLTRGYGNFPELKQNGCSGFVAKTPEGDIIYARDFDSPMTTPGIVYTDAKDSYASVSVSALSWCGWKAGDEKKSKKEKQAILAAPYESLDGINEKGLVIANFRNKGTGKKHIEGAPTLDEDVVIRYVLDKAETVDEAVELIRNINICFVPGWSLHYMIADATGKCAIVEFVRNEMQVVTMEDKFQVVSNFNQYRNEKHAGYGSDRYMNYYNYLKKTNGIISEEDALEILKQNVIEGQAQWSVVYNMTKKTMKVTFSGDYEHVFDYSLDDF